MTLLRPLLAQHGRALRLDEGAATAFVVAMTAVLLVTAGFVLDGGQAINARARVGDDAEQAARAAADQVDVAAGRATGEVVLDGQRAQAAAAAFLAGRGYPRDQVDIAVSADTATVTVRDTVPTAFVLVIGVVDFDVRGSASATALTAQRP